jgi:hypothetical protein
MVWQYFKIMEQIPYKAKTQPHHQVDCQSGMEILSSVKVFYLISAQKI